MTSPLCTSTVPGQPIPMLLQFCFGIPASWSLLSTAFVIIVTTFFQPLSVGYSFFKTILLFLSTIPILIVVPPISTPTVYVIFSGIIVFIIVTVPLKYH